MENSYSSSAVRIFDAPQNLRVPRLHETRAPHFKMLVNHAYSLGAARILETHRFRKLPSRPHLRVGVYETLVFLERRAYLQGTQISSVPKHYKYSEGGEAKSMI